jgi:mRNA-degrading endonuclease YafQ of YafQ-DinJ toxin-antitoxin module
MVQKSNSGPIKIQIEDTNTLLDLMKPFNNDLLAQNKKNKKNIKISILKPIFSNDYIAVVDALGEKGKTVRVYQDKKLLGSYKTIISYTGEEMQKNRKVNGVSEFQLFQFVKKL